MNNENLKNYNEEDEISGIEFKVLDYIYKNEISVSCFYRLLSNLIVINVKNISNKYNDADIEKYCLNGIKNANSYINISNKISKLPWSDVDFMKKLRQISTMDLSKLFFIKKISINKEYLGFSRDYLIETMGVGFDYYNDSFTFALPNTNYQLDVNKYIGENLENTLNKLTSNINTNDLYLDINICGEYLKASVGYNELDRSDCKVLGIDDFQSFKIYENREPIKIDIKIKDIQTNNVVISTTLYNILELLSIKSPNLISKYN